MLSHQRRFFYRTTAVLFSLALSLASLWLIGIFSPTVSQAATTSGPLYAWGGNSNGKLGNGSTTNSSSPLAITLATGITASAITGGSEHSVAIGSDSKLYTWGYNGDGELGDGSTNGSTTPKAITLATGVTPTAISAGQYHSLAIGSDNKLYAWGYNGNGRLGDNSTTTRTSPTSITLATGVTPTAIKAGFDYSLAIGSDNKLYAWGNNASGQLGDNSTTSSLIPKVITLATGVTPTAISAAQGWSMAIGSDGNLYTWGSNAFGQLGDGSTTQSLIPKAVTLATGVTPTAIAATGFHALAIGSDNKLYTWGYNAQGELGNGSTTNNPTPAAVTLASGVTPSKIVSGFFHSLVIGSDGKLYAWGRNDNGQLGDGTTTNRTSPTAITISGSATPLVVGAGYLHSFAILAPPTLSINNVIKAEGNSGTTSFTFTVSLSYAQTQNVTVNYATSNGTATAGSDYTATSGTLTFSPGATTQTITVAVNGDTTQEPNETFLVKLSNPSSTATLTVAQGVGTIVNDEGGVVYAAGANQYGQFGNGTTSSSSTPTAAVLPVAMTAIAAGDFHTLAIGSDGKLYAWGLNNNGQLGDGTTTNRTSPVVITLASGVSPVAIAAGYYSSYAIGSDGNLYAWGLNNLGQLGDGTTTARSTPVVITLASGVTPTAIFSASVHTLAIGSDGNLYSWGYNGAGGVGDGTTSQRNSPVVVTLASGVTPRAIAGGAMHSLAIGSDDKLYAWGDNSKGALGNGTTSNSSTPIAVTLASGVTPTQIMAGVYHSLAVGSDGKLYTWGYNSSGELCNGTTTNSTTPIAVTPASGVSAVGLGASWDNTLAVGSNGKIYQCGLNSSGQLGIGSTTDSATPVVSSLPAGALASVGVVGQQHTMELISTPSLNVGNASHFEGNSGTTSYSFPVTLTYASSQTVTVSYATSNGTATAGSDYTATSGTVTFAPGTTTQTFTVTATGDTTIENNETFFVNLSNPSGATLATAQGLGIIVNDDVSTSTGIVYAWGYGVDGELGNGLQNKTNSPVLSLLPGGVKATTIISSRFQNLMIGSDGNLYAWGFNSSGELGDGTTTSSLTPKMITLASGVTPKAVAAGAYFSLAIGSDNKLYAWGYNGDGELGDGTTTNRATPKVITLANGVTPIAIKAGWDHSMAIGSDGNLYAWGNNSSGQLGDGSTTGKTTPEVITLASGVIPFTIAAGDYHSLAIGSDGKLYAWGYNADGELGDGSITNHNTPEVITLASGITPNAIAAGWKHSVAIGSDGKLYAWGYNTDGELGDGSTIRHLTPEVITLATGVTPASISVGEQHTEAIGSDGNYYGWGLNGDGELGDGSNTNRTSPKLITLPGSALPIAIIAGAYHGLAVIPSPTISIGNISQSEGNSGTSSFSFPVTLTYATSQTVTVNYTTSNGTATAGSDYTATSGTLTIASGSTSGTITVPVLGDTTVEPDETFTVTLSNPSGATLTTSQGTGTILNDDTPTMSIGNVSQSEGNSGTTSFSFPITLSAASYQTVTVSYATSDGTATAGSDYTATSGTLTFAPGTTSQTITVAVNGDTTYEANETFFVTLSSPTGATLATSQGTGTILNDDIPTISIGNISQAEGNSGTSSFSFPVTLTYATSQTITVSYTTSNGTATAGSDYTATSGTLTFAPGITSQTITVLVVGDTVVEPDETFTVTLSSPSGATLATSQGTGTILNDDIPTISIGNVSQAEGNSGTTSFSFPITLSTASYQSVSVNYATSDGTATAGSDYTATSATFLITPGTTSGTITVAVNGDTTYEPDETFFVNLSNPSGATLATSQAIGTILNDDPQPTTLSLTSSPNPSIIGQSVTFTATISPVAASGTVTFSEGAVTLGTGTLNGGVATFSTTSLTVGSHNISALYGGDSSYAASSATSITQNVNQASSTTTLTAAPNPTSYSQSVTFTATVSPATATGTITFSFDSTTPVTATLDGNGLATYITSTLNVGQHTVIATYNGDTNLTASSSATLTETITAGAANQVSVVSGSGQSATVNTAFANPLVAQVKDSFNNPVSGASVTFTAPSTGASGTFAGGGTTYNGTTDSSGLVTTTAFTVNATAGSYSVTATVSGVSSPANFSLTNTAGTASGLVLVSGDNQQTVISTAFANPLVAKVTDGSGNAVTGVQVSFTAPASGASARFGGSAVYTGTTDSSGLVTTTLPTANSTAGSYTVSAAIVAGTYPARALRGSAGPRVTTLQYHLTNLAGAPTTISVVSGSGQSATVNTSFSNPLVAKVVDSGANPVSGASVTFSAPGSGASGTFGLGGTSYSGQTDSSGLITITFTANGTAGAYSVTATVNGVATPASFSLTNLSGCNPLLVTSALDDGSCGTLRQALVAASTSPTKTVTINLTAGSVISLTTGLTLTSGVSITTTASCGSGANNTMVPPITLQGVGASSGNGLTLAGSNNLYGLWVRGFSGLQIKAPVGSSTKMQCVKASKS